VKSGLDITDHLGRNLPLKEDQVEYWEEGKGIVGNVKLQVI
jgi:hypothetical protein